ncbi:lipid A biosynthesis lauroyl acyltransferase [Coralloluteibacterium stylophorae]|uniref:Lipid A biosynthesis lauroyl acyltransferase n=1 Tax=Coralloluteibacterium stylophorae TaxID=1776034 RepID=A0A8J8AYR8_9GAMM|nr:lipid A biosynthesis lauroyl acyltransferase [Coralloluteibacterium stylophorae]MBS7457937.1 lipid A biosynthesis lauroyl acyltransferase [Coralloluteibacterium stylophorae]
MASEPLTAPIFYRLAWLAGHLPRALVEAIARLGAAWIHRGNGRTACVTRRNVELIGAAAEGSEREALVRAILHGTVRNTLETLQVWTHPADCNLRRRIRQVHGAEAFDAALGAGRGLIVAAPHYGNWELLNQYLASRAPITIVYAPPASAAGDAFLRRVRGGPNVQQARAEPAAVRTLYRALQRGDIVGILPDQQPKRGEGEFAPFFGRPALTMSLLPKLARRTGAPVLAGFAERNADGSYDIHFQPVPPALSQDDEAAAVAALNAAVEQVARRDPAQYQWTYKRFSIHPDGGAANPYWPDCYPNRHRTRAKA